MSAMQQMIQQQKQQDELRARMEEKRDEATPKKWLLLYIRYFMECTCFAIFLEFHFSYFIPDEAIESFFYQGDVSG